MRASFLVGNYGAIEIETSISDSPLFFFLCPRPRESGFRYKLASGGAFNALVKVSLKFVKPLLDHHLPVAHAKTGKGAPLPMTSKGWKKLRAPIKVYLNSVAQLMSQLTDSDAQNFVLHYDRALCPYYACKSPLKQDSLWDGGVALGFTTCALRACMHPLFYVLLLSAFGGLHCDDDKT